MGFVLPMQPRAWIQLGGAGFRRRRVAVPPREGAEPQERVRGRAAKG